MSRVQYYKEIEDFLSIPIEINFEEELENIFLSYFKEILIEKECVFNIEHTFYFKSEKYEPLMKTLLICMSSFPYKKIYYCSLELRIEIQRMYEMSNNYFDHFMIRMINKHFNFSLPFIYE